MLENGVYTTTDMALATLLRSQGLSYRLVRQGRAKVVWHFKPKEADESDLLELLLRYDAGDVRVEPRKFVRDFTATRTELYRVLGRPIPGQRRLRPSSGTASA